MGRRVEDEPDVPPGSGDPRYVIRVPASEAPVEPEPVPARGGRTEAPEERPASDYVIRVGPEVPASPGDRDLGSEVEAGGDAAHSTGRPSSPRDATSPPAPAAPSAPTAPAETTPPDQAPPGPPEGTVGGTPPRARPPRAARRLLVVAAVVVVLALAAFAVVRSGVLRDPNPFAGRDLYVDPDSEAARAVDASTDAPTREAFLVLAEQPTAIWLTPEERPAGEVGPYVAQVVAAADASGTLPVFVVYGIPDRDCGQLSAGGATLDGYAAWVDEIAAALDGTTTPVILEPDAVSLAEQCGDVDLRMALLAAAGATLTDAGAVVYLDGGHSGWHSVQEAAALLRLAGVADVHGFATNVSNYNRDASELVYAQRLSAQLDGAPFVIDTGRNGHGSDGTWCNPAGAALGAPPLTLDAEGLDANLWVKPPGESDGTCEGGPGAGEWWPDRALSLVTGARG